MSPEDVVHDEASSCNQEPISGENGLPLEAVNLVAQMDSTVEPNIPSSGQNACSAPEQTTVMSEEEYQDALVALENSLDCLKLIDYEELPAIPMDERVGEDLIDDPDLPIPAVEVGPIPWEVEENPEGSARLLEAEDDDCDEDLFYTTLANHLRRLIAEEKKNRSPNFEKLMLLTVLSDYNVVRELLRRQGSTSPNIMASEQIAACKAVASKDGQPRVRGKWYARRLRSQAMHVARFGVLPDPTQGKGATHSSLLLNDEVRRGILSYIRSLGVGQITPKRLLLEVNQKILPALGIASPISEPTALRWLCKLGYTPRSHSKGVYMDGHERSDVIEYRSKFLAEIKSIEPLVQQYDDNTGNPLPLEIPMGQKEHVFVTQDESAFHTNDQANTKWLKSDEQQLRQKSRGRLIHVSDFLTEKYGPLALTQEMKAENAKLPDSEKLCTTEARVIIEPGKGRDDWWDMDQLCKQIHIAVKIYDKMYPDTTGVFLFDQSSAHGAFGDDALVARRMNVGSGGKSVKPMRATRIPMDNPNPALRGQPQSMVLPPGHPKAGEPKGMRIILEERGLLETLDTNRSGQPVGVCAICKQSEAARTKAEKEARERMREDPDLFPTLDDAGFEDIELVAPQARSKTCCMLRCLESQQDFIEEKPRIQSIIEKAGHKCMFYPKFHCELNPIEMYWGYAKRRFREQCDGKTQTARQLVPRCLDSCSIITIRHFWRKCWRYMDAYTKGLTGKQAEFAVKKYKSHRRIGLQIMTDI